MGYDIRIGRRLQREDGTSFVADEIVMEAPAFPGDDSCAYANKRSPSYSAWQRFCETTGLHRLFFDADTGLLANHPGIVDITPAHLAEVRRAVDRYRRPRPGVEPGYGGSLDYDLARLLWLDWWMRWAVENCESPAIQNW